MKYFCKITQSICEDKIKGDAKNTWITHGRFSLRYNTTGNFSLVKISNLSTEDAGKYRCAVDVTLSNNNQLRSEFTEASLDIIEQGALDHSALK